MAVDLNMDMGSIMGAFKKKSGSSSGPRKPMHPLVQEMLPYKYTIMGFAALLMIISLYINLVHIPLKEENAKRAEEVSKLIDMRDKIGTMKADITRIENKLDQSKDMYIQELSHFGNSEDLGDLYNSISKIATKYNLVVLNIKEAEKAASPASAPNAKAAAAKAREDAKAAAKAGEPVAKDAAPKEDANKPKVTEIRVDVELKGPYSDYIKFKQDLAIAEVLLKVNNESITVKETKEGGEEGGIYVKLNLSTYAIDKEPFNKVIENHGK